MKFLRWFSCVLVVAILGSLFSGPAMAEEKINVVGKIVEYDIEAKTLTIVTADKKEMTFTIKDKKALAKLDDRLFPGDEVKIKYVVVDGKNTIENTGDMKGTKAGC